MLQGNFFNVFAICPATFVHFDKYTDTSLLYLKSDTLEYFQHRSLQQGYRDVGYLP